MDDINSLRNIPSIWDSSILLGGYKTDPDPCTNRLEYKNMGIVKQKITKIKEEFQTKYLFDNCSLTDSKISWGKLNYVKISGCRAEGTSFSQFEMAYGDGVSDSRIEKCKVKNAGLFNLPIFRSYIIDGTFEERMYLSNISFSECVLEKNKADDLHISQLKIFDNKCSGLNTSVRIQFIYSQRNSYNDINIEGGRIKAGKFIGDELKSTRFVDIKFQECYFKEIDFSDTVFENCLFTDCLFDDCTYTAEQGTIFGIKDI